MVHVSFTTREVDRDSDQHCYYYHYYYYYYCYWLESSSGIAYVLQDRVARTPSLNDPTSVSFHFHSLRHDCSINIIDVSDCRTHHLHLLHVLPNHVSGCSNATGIVVDDDYYDVHANACDLNCHILSLLQLQVLLHLSYACSL